MVLPVRIELTTSPLPMGCSTTELRQHEHDLVRKPEPLFGTCSKGSEYPINGPMSSH